MSRLRWEVYRFVKTFLKNYLKTMSRTIHDPLPKIEEPTSKTNAVTPRNKKSHK